LSARWKLRLYDGDNEPRFWSLSAMSSKYPLTPSEQSIRLMGGLRKIVLSGDVAAERILHFVALVLPLKQAMLYLINTSTSSCVRADPVVEK
jgi:hypothetical protein